MKPTLSRDDDRLSDATEADGLRSHHAFLKYAPPIKAAAAPRTVLSTMLAAGLIATGTPACAARFDIDQRRTEVRFVYKMAYATQRGRFTKVGGTLDFDEAAPEKSKINAAIEVASLDTGEAYVDKELKGKAFFNAAASPVIAFKSLAVKPSSATAAEVSGEITINGITKIVTLKVRIEAHNDPALKHDAGARKFFATTRIQRSAFKMTEYQSFVDDEIDLEIDAVVVPAGRIAQRPRQ
jgi:polyisoprenoid-binding protein YceI